MIDAQQSSIKSFFIFNSSIGPREGESNAWIELILGDTITQSICFSLASDLSPFATSFQIKSQQATLNNVDSELKRILFYHPNSSNVDHRKIQVGLCEAVIKFMSTFSTEPCECLQTQSSKHIFYQPEDEYWMVLVASIPYAAKPQSGATDNVTDIVEPTVMRNYLLSAYRTFRMFIGRFKDIPVEDIYDKCEQFFNPYLVARALTNEATDVIQGVSYLPLDKNSFLRVLCFIDLVEVKHPEFKCVAFVYNEQLIWNGLAKDDMLTLFQYLVQTLLPVEVEKEIQGGSVVSAQRHGRYINLPEGIQSREDLDRLARVFLMREEDTEAKEYYLVVYRCLSATICFTVDVDTPIDLDKFRALDTFMGPQLSNIASSISEQCAAHALQNAHLQNTDNKYIYFNRINLAFKTSQLPNKLIPSTAIKPEVLSIIAEMHSDKKSLGNYGEIIIKTPDEYWITGKTSNEREFYVVIQEKNANLKEIADEVRRISDSQMKGIFFYPL